MIQLKTDAAISDETLNRIGEVAFRVVTGSNDSAYGRELKIYNPKPSYGCRAVGGTFKDGSDYISYSTNNVQSFIPAKDSDLLIFVGNKYSILASNSSLALNTSFYNGNKICLQQGDFFNVPSLKYLTISSLWGKDFSLLKVKEKFDLSAILSFNCLGQAAAQLSPNSISMDLSDFSNIANMTNISISEENYLTGNLSSLAEGTNLTTLNLRNCDSIEGSVESLTTLVSLTSLKVDLSNNINGSLENLFAGMFNNRKSGALSVVFGGSKVTWNGSTSGELYNYTATFSESGIVVVRGSTQVATYDGSTWTYGA